MLLRITIAVSLLMLGCKTKKVTYSAEENREKYYQKCISSGDQHYKAGDFTVARNEYEKALLIKPGEAYPRAQLEMVKRLPDKKEEGLLYVKVLEKADNYYQAKNYVKALDIYQRAQGMNAKDTLVTSRIKNCEYQLKLLEEQK